MVPKTAISIPTGNINIKNGTIVNKSTTRG